MLEDSQDSSSNYRKKFSFSNSKSPKSDLDSNDKTNIKIPFNSNQNDQKQAFTENKPYKARDPSTKISIFLDENMKLLLTEKENNNGRIELFETDSLGTDQSKERIININDTKKYHEELFQSWEDSGKNREIKKKIKSSDDKTYIIKKSEDKESNDYWETVANKSYRKLNDLTGFNVENIIMEKENEYKFNTAERMCEYQILPREKINSSNKEMEDNQKNYIDSPPYFEKKQTSDYEKSVIPCEIFNHDYSYKFKEEDDVNKENEKLKDLGKNVYLDINCNYIDNIKNNNLANQNLNDNKFLNYENLSNAYINYNNEYCKTNNSNPFYNIAHNNTSEETENISFLPLQNIRDKFKIDSKTADNINENVTKPINKSFNNGTQNGQLYTKDNKDLKIHQRKDVFENQEFIKITNNDCDLNLGFLKNEEKIDNHQSNYNNLTIFLNKINESDSNSVNCNNEFLPIKNQKLLFNKENQKITEFNNLIQSDINKNNSNNYKNSMNNQNNIDKNNNLDLKNFTDLNKITAGNLPVAGLDNIGFMLQMIKSINNNINLNVLSKLMDMNKQQNMNLNELNHNTSTYGSYSAPNPSTPISSEKIKTDIACQIQNMISNFNFNKSPQNDIGNYINNIILNTALMNSNPNMGINNFRSPTNQDSNLLKNLKDLQFLISKTSRINTENLNPNCWNTSNSFQNLAAEAEKKSFKPQEKPHSDKFLYDFNGTKEHNLFGNINTNNISKNHNQNINFNYSGISENGYFSVIPGYLNDNNNLNKSFSFPDEFHLHNTNNINNRKDKTLYQMFLEEKEKNKLLNKDGNLPNSNFLNDNSNNIQSLFSHINHYSNDINKSNLNLNSSKKLLDEFKSSQTNKYKMHSQDDFYGPTLDLNIVNSNFNNKINNKTNEKNGKKNVTRNNTKNKNSKEVDTPINNKKKSKLDNKQIELITQNKDVNNLQSFIRGEKTIKNQMFPLEGVDEKLGIYEAGKNENNPVKHGLNQAQSSSDVKLLSQKRGRESNLKSKKAKDHNSKTNNSRGKNNVLFSNPDYNNLHTTNFYNFLSKNQSNISSEGNSESSNKSDLSPIMIRNVNLTQNLLKNGSESAVLELRDYNSEDIIESKALSIKCFSGKGKRAKPEKKEIGFSYYVDEEKNKRLKQQIQEFTKIYPEELDKILKVDSHKFMYDHFPEMYNKIDNFYINIVNLNKKRQLNYKKTSAIIDSIENFAKNFDKEDKEKIDLKALNIPYFKEDEKKIAESSYKEAMLLENDCYNSKFECKEKTEKIDFHIINQITNRNTFTNETPDCIVNSKEINENSFQLDKDLYLSEDLRLDEQEFFDINKVESSRNLKTSRKNKKANNSIEDETKIIDNEMEKDLKTISVENKMIYDEKNEIINFKKRENYIKLWDPIKIKDEDVHNYVLEVEKVWPFSYYYWSEENALEFLYRNNYEIKTTIDLIKFNDEMFQMFMKKKETIKLDFCTDNKSSEIDTRRPAKKSLRSNKTMLK